MSNKEKITLAIDERHIIYFNYQEHPRIAEPYHYGSLIRTPKGSPINPPRLHHFLCYQIGGTSKSGKMTYKTMDLNQIKHLKISNKAFEIREDYNPNDTKWAIEYGANLKQRLHFKKRHYCEIQINKP